MSGLVIGIAFFSSLSFRRGTPLILTTQGFFSLIGRGQIHEAYEEGAREFRQFNKVETFRKKALALGLDRYKSSEWSKVLIYGKKALLEGTVTLKDNKTISLRVTLVKELRKWRVADFEKK